MTNAPDYSEYEDKPVDLSDKMAQVTKLAEKQRALEVEIAEAEKSLDTKRQELKHLAEKALPEILDELGMEEFTTKSGLKVKVAEAIRASIPKARTDEAMDWLDEHGFSRLIKRAFVIEFPKEEDAWANKFEGDLKKRKRPLDVKREKKVHNQTLCAFIREQLEAGEDLPLDLFGVFRQRYTKVEVKK